MPLPLLDESLGEELHLLDGEVWVVVAVEPDADPAYAGRIFFKQRERAT